MNDYIINYEILDYDKLNNKLKELVNNKNSINPVILHDPIGYSTCGFPIMHYSIGTGSKHIILFAGVHGNEIIGVDFIIQFMTNLSLGKGEFKYFLKDKYTIDFLPLINPEGIFTTTYGLKVILENKEVEKVCHEYYKLYKEDDLNNNIEKYHQKFLDKITINCIPIKDKNHYNLFNKLKDIYKDHDYPLSTLGNFYANGNGVNLNDNNPYYYEIFKKRLQSEGIIYAKKRENNIIISKKSPIGMPNYNMHKSFRYEKENKALLDFFNKLNTSKEYYMSFNIHSSGGMLYAIPIYNESYSKNNLEKANIYINKIYEVAKDSYKIMPKGSTITGVGDILRESYPYAFLLELSKMGGNPLGPYGDIKTYKLTILANMLAIMSII